MNGPYGFPLGVQFLALGAEIRRRGKAMMNNAGPYPREAFEQERVDDPRDQHVMPMYGREHVSSATCWCKPRVDYYPGPLSGGRVWVHREEN